MGSSPDTDDADDAASSPDTTTLTRVQRAEQGRVRAAGMVAEGRSFEEIAAELGVTERTVRRYLA